MSRPQTPRLGASGSTSTLLTPRLPPAMVPTAKVELSLAAKDLKNRDLISKSDPYAVLYVKDNGPKSKWTKIGETESILNDLNPTWAKQFTLDYFFQTHQHIKVKIYDRDDSNANDPKDTIGKAKFTLGQIMGATGQSASITLTKKGVDGPRGSLLIRAEQVQECRDHVQCQLSASNLANVDGFFSKSDPFVVVSRQRDDKTWQPVYKSEVIENDLNPTWRPFELSMQKLCSVDHNRPILIQVLDQDNSGQAELIGQLETTFENLIAAKANASALELHNEALQQKKGKKYTNAGLLMIKGLDVFRVPSFLEFLRGGLEMNLIIGIDYTGSNGPPHDPRSLHFINPQQPNQYQHAINATGLILQEYDSDKNFPVYGFGGIPAGSVDVNHCFPINFNPTNPEVHGIPGVLQLYQQSLTQVQLHGPTLFSPLITQAAHIANYFAADPTKQKYFVLLILTDGAIMDMPQTIDALVHAANNSPLSVVIIGVGDADFSSMQALDGDGRALKSSDGYVASRDIVQFVPFSRFATDPMALARETLAEIPNQLCQYMKVRNIQPNPSITPTFKEISTS